MLRLVIVMALMTASIQASTFMLKYAIGTSVGILEADGGFVAAGVIGDSCMLMKVDCDGGILWTNRILFPGGEPRNLAALSDGGFLLAGTSMTVAGEEAYIVKTNADGQFVWDSALGLGVASQALDCVESAAGLIAVCGSIQNSQWPDGEGFVSLVSQAGAVLETAVLDLYEYGASLNCISSHPDSGLAVAGEIQDSYCWALMIEKDLSVAWSQRWDETLYWVDMYDCVSTEDMGMAVVGYGPTGHYSSSNFLNLIDSAGTVGSSIHYLEAGQWYHPTIPSIDRIDTGGFCMTSFNGNFLLRADVEGGEIWRTYFPDIYVGGRSVRSCSDGGFIVLGNTMSSDSSWIVKTNGNGTLDPTGISDDGSVSSESALQIFVSPNPVTFDASLLVSQGPGDVGITIYDFAGHVVSGFIIDEGRRGSSIDLPSQTGSFQSQLSGVYLLQAISTQGTATCRMVILAR